MSFITNLFGGLSSPAPQPSPGDTNQHSPAANGSVPQAPAVPSAPQEPVSPLSPFTDVWSNAGNEQVDTPMFAGLDPTKLMESARKVNFTQGVTPEQFQAISAGGDGAIQAWTSSMNAVAQQVYAQSAMATAKIVEQAIGKAQTSQDARLPNLVKKLSANEGLMTQNPLLANPAIQPLVGALQEQLVRKNPNATSAEIQQQVQDYFAALGSSFGPKPVESPKQRAAKNETDWSNF